MSQRQPAQIAEAYPVMMSYIRYALALLCFAASVGCLALWWRMSSQPRVITLLP